MLVGRHTFNSFLLSSSIYLELWTKWWKRLAGRRLCWLPWGLRYLGLVCLENPYLLTHILVPLWVIWQQDSRRIISCMMFFFFVSRDINCVLEGSLHLKIIHELHNEGHVGRDKTLKLMSDQFYWPSMRKEVAKFVEGCQICQVSKGTTTNARLYMPLPILDQL